MTTPKYVLHLDAFDAYGEPKPQIIQATVNGNYRTWLQVRSEDAAKAQEVVRGLNELEKQRARGRREAARRRRNKTT